MLRVWEEMDNPKTKAKETQKHSERKLFFPLWFAVTFLPLVKYGRGSDVPVEKMEESRLPGRGSRHEGGE